MEKSTDIPEERSTGIEGASDGETSPAEAEECCDATKKASCCEPKAKPACCGPTGNGKKGCCG